MFDDLIKEIKKLEQNTSYSMQILCDEEGYVDKECPDSKCLKKFKVYAEDWNQLLDKDSAYCPFCGFDANIDQWFTTEQVEQAKSQAIQKIQCDFEDALSKGIKAANRKLNNSFNKRTPLKMSVSYKGSGKIFVDMPASALEEMKQKIICPFCGFRYEVIGSGFFCPKCGENSATQTFNNTIEKVRGNIKNVSIIYKTLAKDNKDEATRTCDSLRINSIGDLVIAFQRLCESIYKKIMPNDKIRKNLFQRLDDGSSKYKNATGLGYEDLISKSELDKLKICFQKRHCFNHNDGIVDDDYINKSGDNSYKIGQHLNIGDSEIILYLKTVEKLGNEIIKLGGRNNELFK